MQEWNHFFYCPLELCNQLVKCGTTSGIALNHGPRHDLACTLSHAIIVPDSYGYSQLNFWVNERVQEKRTHFTEKSP
jgi:hypothetical protein